MDNILSGENVVKKKKTKLIIGSGLILAICAIIIIIIAVSLKKGGNKGQVRTKVNKATDSDYKYTSIDTVVLPERIKYEGHAIYSKTGHIILLYKMENDTNTSYIGVMDEDGSNLKKIWEGEWKNYYGAKANGIRLMPFDDNKKILTGDYVLECSPNIDNCQKSELLPVIYPPEALNLEGMYFIWSEIVVSPDEHIAWSTLSMIHDNVNFIGQLVKNETNYIITNVQIISTLGFIEYEDEEKGILKHDTLRGGEIKQFTNGGEALTLAGSGDAALAKSVFQNLVGYENYPITHFPGYEETTIISPDGKLGLVMTTRFSPKTSSEILGYMTRPLCVYTLKKMNRYVYFYGIQEVRKSRPGNIGPALINIEESRANSSYMGYDLHTEGWAFKSPLSLSPNGKKGMFSETYQDGNNNKHRIRIVKLDNYKPSSIFEAKKTPDNIPYAKSLDSLKNLTVEDINGYFNGKSSGIMIFNSSNSFSQSEYKNYSDDGKTFYNGFEKYEAISQTTGKLTSYVVMSGEQQGEMNLTITMNYQGNIVEKKGYVNYNGKYTDINDCY
jgi:hypothetical protein